MRWMTLSYTYERNNACICICLLREGIYKIHQLPPLDGWPPSFLLFSEYQCLCSVLHSHKYSLYIQQRVIRSRFARVSCHARRTIEISAIRSAIILRLSQELNPKNLDVLSSLQIRRYFPKIHAFGINFYLNETKLRYSLLKLVK